MKIRIVLLFLAIIFGIAAVIGVMIYLNNLRSSIEKEGELVTVVVAAQDIPRETEVFEMIERKFIETKEIPRKYLVEGALESLDNYRDFVAIGPIVKGEQFTPGKLGKIEEVRMAFTVPDGFIALSISYNEIKGVSNLIKAGDKVNVITTFTPSKDELVLFNKDIVTQSLIQISETDSGEITDAALPSSEWFSSEIIMDESNYIVYPVTKILLWNIEVLYIGSKIPGAADEQPSASAPAGSKSTAQELRTITLALTPQQAEKLVFSEELGKVWLALVPADGINEEETPGRTYLNIID